MKMSDVFSSELFLDDEWLGIYCEERQVFKPNFHFDNWKSEANAAIEAINNHDYLTETNRLLNLECDELKGDKDELTERVKELEEAFGKLKVMAMQEREWRIEDSELGNCEAKESMESFEYKIDKLLDK